MFENILYCLCLSENQKEEEKKKIFKIEVDKNKMDNNGKKQKDDFGIESLNIGNSLIDSEINGANINTNISYQLLTFNKEKFKNTIYSNKYYGVQELNQSLKKQGLKENDFLEKYNNLIKEKKKKLKILNENQLFQDFNNKVDGIISDFKKNKTISESDDNNEN